MHIVDIKYSPDYDLVTEFRAARKRHDARRARILHETLSPGFLEELRELWRMHPDAGCIGVRYDHQKAIIGSTVDEVWEKAEELFGTQEPLLDNLVARAPYTGHREYERRLLANLGGIEEARAAAERFLAANK